MSGLIGRKIGMTSLFDENGKNIPCTVIEAGPCVVTQVRTEEVDGYNALQLGFDDKKAKSSNKALDGHFKKAGTTAKRKVIEFQGFEKEYNLGDFKPGIDLIVKKFKFKILPVYIEGQPEKYLEKLEKDQSPLKVKVGKVFDKEEDKTVEEMYKEYGVVDASIPSDFNLFTVAWNMGVILVLTLLSVLYPIFKVNSLTPTEAMHHV